MTRSRSSRGRHRGRRGRPDEGVRPQEDGQATEGERAEHGEGPDTARTPAEQRADGTLLRHPSGMAYEQRAEQRTGQRAESPGQQRGPARSGGRSGGAARPPVQRGSGGPPQAGSAPTRAPRRRQQRKPTILEVSGEIIKRRAEIAAVPGKMIKRSMEGLEGPDGPVLGCPMLTRTRLGLPVTDGHPAPRCSLGWGIHAEEEAMYCMMTPDLTLCWKANPERVEVLRAELDERDTAAD